MYTQVPVDVQEEAMECKNGMSCIAEGHCTDKEPCKVQRVGCRNVLFLVDDKRVRTCSYLMKFGPDQICTCPVCYYLYTHTSDEYATCGDMCEK